MRLHSFLHVICLSGSFFFSLFLFCFFHVWVVATRSKEYTFWRFCWIKTIPNADHQSQRFVFGQFIWYVKIIASLYLSENIWTLFPQDVPYVLHLNWSMNSRLTDVVQQFQKVIVVMPPIVCPSFVKCLALHSCSYWPMSCHLLS